MNDQAPSTRSETRQGWRGWFAGPLALTVCGIVLLAALPGLANANRLRMAVVKEAHSPVLKQLKKRIGHKHLRVDRFHRHHARAKRYDLLVMDGDELSPRRMAHRKELKRFASRHRWTLAVDVGNRHHKRALERETGFSVTKPGRPHNSDAFLFRRTRLNGSGAVVMFDAHPFGGLPKELTKKERHRARKRKARNTAREIAKYVTASKAKLTRLAAPGGAAPGDGGIPAELQHVLWSYTVQGSGQTPDAYYTEGYNSDFRYDPAPAIQHLTPNWTLTHTFNVYLDNSTQHPQGDKQIVTYDLNGEVNPRSPGEPWVHMYDNFRRGTATNIQMERAWWTGMVGNTVTPDGATNGKLLWQASEPANPNAETSYSSGHDFTVGFEGSNEGGGINASYGVHDEQSHTVQDWGVENRGSQNNLDWRFSARHPCDARPDHYDETQCFNVGPSLALPQEPNDLSRGQMQVATSARWNTKSVLDGSDGQLSFTVDDPIQIDDSVCEFWGFGTFACNVGNRAVNRYDTGPGPQTFTIDASVVNPVPIKSLTFSPAQANGAANETVTGTITLDHAVGTDTSIVMYSDSNNAPLGVPSSGFSSKVITVPKGQDSGTFTTTTNDNGLSPGGHVTANITAFYADSFTKTLRICAGSPPC